MKILITGVAGFVGAHLARQCLAEGDDVWGTVRPGGRPGPAGVHVVEADVRDGRALSAALAAFRPEAVVHLAGWAAPSTSSRNPSLVVELNAGGTLVLLQAVAQSAPSAFVVLAGSAEEYGAVAPDEIPIREDLPFRPISPYGISKVAVEMAGRYAARVLGLRVTTLRAFNQLGPGQSTGFVTSDIARQIARAERGWDLPVVRVGDLSARRDFTDVRDVARAYHLATRGLGAPAYNVGSGRSIEIREILHGLVELTQVPLEVVTDPDLQRPLRVPEMRADASRFMAATGWHPVVPLDVSLADALDAWRTDVDSQPPA